jgi:hypothetical protein
MNLIVLALWQECIRLLVDVFAADVGCKDNAGRTAMATLVLRHKSMRPGIGPHAAKKLQLIESLSSTMGRLEEGDSASDNDSDLDNMTPRRGMGLLVDTSALGGTTPGLASSRSRASAATGSMNPC